MTARERLRKAVSRCRPNCEWRSRDMIEMRDAAEALLAEPTGLTADEQSGVEVLRAVAVNDGERPATRSAAVVALRAIYRLSHVQAPTLTEGTWAWAVEQMRAGRTVKRHVWLQRSGIMLKVKGGEEIGFAHHSSDFVPYLCDFEATDWEVVPPPEPAHKPCAHCGSRAELHGLKNPEGPHARCTNDDCDCRTRSQATPAEAWALWDRRAGGGA